MSKLICSLFTTFAFASLSLAEEQSLPRSTPEAQGVSSAAILEFVRAADQNVDTMNSFMLVRHGEVVAECWWTPYTAETPHVLYSLSKSFTSTAVGLAIHEGKLSLDDEVTQFFPDDLPAEPSNNLNRCGFGICFACRPDIRLSRGCRRQIRNRGHGCSWRNLSRSSRGLISFTTQRERTCNRPLCRR